MDNSRAVTRRPIPFHPATDTTRADGGTPVFMMIRMLSCPPEVQGLEFGMEFAFGMAFAAVLAAEGSVILAG